MRIFDETKMTEIFSPDLSLGKLVDDKIFIAHHPKVYAQGETYRWKVVDGEYVKDIITPAVEGHEAWDEYEDIKVFVPYTEAELKENRMCDIRDRLSRLSEDMIQAMAGEIVPDLDDRKAEFVALHNELRALEGKEPRETAQA